MDIEKRLKDIAWTGGEIAVVIGGASVAQRFLNDEKIFKKHFSEHPEWFQGRRTGAPWYVKFSGGIKAAGALWGLQLVDNPWIKLGLMGFAFQGMLQQGRVLTHKEGEKGGLRKIGASDHEALKKVDDYLRSQARLYQREINAPEYLGENHPSEVGAFNNNYSSQVAGVFDEMGMPVGAPGDYGDRYKSQVAGIFDEGDYNFHSSDRSRAA